MTTIHGLPSLAQELLVSCPRSGDGVHNWLFRTARVLHPYYSDKHEIAALLAKASAGCGRQVEHREIMNAIRNSEACTKPTGTARKDSPSRHSSRWPAVNDEQKEAVIGSGFGLADLWEASPLRIEDNDCHTEELIDQLFPANPLLCCGWSHNRFDTRRRQRWRGELDQMQFVVPSPMSAEEGRTKDGRRSRHSLNNTGPRRFLVIEFDTGELDHHAAILWHLAQHAPLTLTVHSGNKSLHGWFFCHSQSEGTLLRLFTYAVRLGADPATWTRSLFTRMPDGRRENGARQSVFYFNPATIRL